MRTAEEKASWRCKMKSVAKRVNALSSLEQTELAAEIGTVTAEGRPLSSYNCIFLSMQCSGRFPLSMVAGFRHWQRAGRKVRKGEHAAGYIYVPTRGKAQEDEEEDSNTRFLLVPVFDLTQTDEIN